MPNPRIKPSTDKATRTPAKKTKDQEIRLRIQEDHKQALIEAAHAEGLELSAWIRQLALRAAGIIPPGQRPTK